VKKISVDRCVKNGVKTMTVDELIRIVNNDPRLLEEFKNGWGPDRTIEEYLDEYSYIDSIADYLASDLGILS